MNKSADTTLQSSDNCSLAVDNNNVLQEAQNVMPNEQETSKCITTFLE